MNEGMVCPKCGQGTLESEIIEEYPNGERIERYYFSCGYKKERINLPSGKGVIDSKLVKLKSRSNEKIRNKPFYELEEKWQKNDQDNPKEPVISIFYKNRDTRPTSVFQVIKYESGKLKHIDCKTFKDGNECENRWDHYSKCPLEDKFIFADKEPIIIQCLKCNAKFEK